MRYPVGFRDQWTEAIEAANESASMTGLRYSVYFVDIPAGPRTDAVRSWQFAPCDTPDRTLHMPTRV